MLSRLKRWFTDQKSLLVAAIAIALLILLFWVFSIPCPIKFLTGISCAGCGMTRAWLSVLHLDFSAAIDYHPLFWAVPIAFLCFLLLRRYPLFSKCTLAIILTLDIAVYLFRMFDPDCTIVTFEPTNALIYRIILFLLSKAGIS